MVVENELPDSEIVKQVFSRGNRSMGNQEGTLFKKGKESDERHDTRKLTEMNGAKFEDGADVIRGMQVYLDDKDNISRYKSLVESSDEGWMVKKSIFLGDESKR